VLCRRRGPTERSAGHHSLSSCRRAECTPSAGQWSTPDVLYTGQTAAFSRLRVMPLPSPSHSRAVDRRSLIFGGMACSGGFGRRACAKCRLSVRPAPMSLVDGAVGAWSGASASLIASERPVASIRSANSRTPAQPTTPHPRRDHDLRTRGSTLHLASAPSLGLTEPSTSPVVPGGGALPSLTARSTRVVTGLSAQPCVVGRA
jgi:hypothetical protein